MSRNNGSCRYIPQRAEPPPACDFSSLAEDSCIEQGNREHTAPRPSTAVGCLYFKYKGISLAERASVAQEMQDLIVILGYTQGRYLQMQNIYEELWLRISLYY